MAAVWYRFRAELRARWRALLALALLAGIAGGAVLAAVAGARRTDTAYSRLVAETKEQDVLVNPDLGTESALPWRDVLRLPQVAEAGRIDGLTIFPADVHSPDDFDRFGITLASRGAVGYSFARPKILDGSTRCWRTTSTCASGACCTPGSCARTTSRASRAVS